MYSTQIQQLRDLFLKGEMRRDLWTHEAHFVVATCLLIENDFNDILPLMRDLIKRNNVFMGIQNTQTSGYHETLTWFYLDEIKKVLFDKHELSQREAVHLILQSTIIDKKYPLKFYDPATLFSPAARAVIIKHSTIHV